MGRACLQDAGPIAASRVFSQMHGQQRVQAAQAHSTMLAGRCAAPMSLLNTPLGRTPRCPQNGDSSPRPAPWLTLYITQCRPAGGAV